MQRLTAFGVHLFTASGAACALFAMIAASRGQWTMMFVWLGAALLIDGLDGTLARRAQVAQLLPRWSGDRLDLVIDYTTYVFIPAFALATSGLLPDGAALLCGVGIVVSGAIYFADRQMKLPDNNFRGFPALWNGMAFHLFLLKLPPWIAVAVIVVFIALTFMPIRFIHPIRFARLRIINIIVVVIWSMLGLYALLQELSILPAAAWLATICGLYLLTAGMIVSRLERKAN